MPENTVAVDRSTEWGNPFIIKKWPEDGYPFVVECSSQLWRCESRERAQEVAVIGFRNWLAASQRSKHRARAALALRGKNLACWCSLDQPCHADVLLEIANA